MTTKPVAHRPVGNARFVTEDTAGTQQSLGGVRAGWPLSIVRTGAGTTSDANTWDEQAAVVLDLMLSVINPILPTSELTGGRRGSRSTSPGSPPTAGRTDGPRCAPRSGG